MIPQRWPLPDGWRWMRLGDALQGYKNTNPEKSTEQIFHYIDIGSINAQSKKIEEYKTFKGKDAPSRARRVVKTGDVLFSTVRP